MPLTLGSIVPGCHTHGSRPRCVGNRLRPWRERRAHCDKHIAGLVAPLPLTLVVALRAVRALAILEARNIRHVQPVVHKVDCAADALATEQRDAVLLLALQTRTAAPIAKATTGSAEGAVSREFAFEHIVFVDPSTGTIVVIDCIWLGAAWVCDVADVRPVGDHMVPLHHRVGLGAQRVCPAAFDRM